MKILKHKFKKNLAFDIEVKLYVDEEKQSYWIEVNGYKETNIQSIPNVVLNERKILEKELRTHEIVNKA